MQNSKLIKLLNTLSKTEFRLLNRYLRSPFFNYSPAVLGLYEWLQRYHPDFDHPQLDRGVLFGHVFPGEPYDDKKLRNLLHEFSRHIEDFMVQLQLRQDDYRRQSLLLDALAAHDLYPEFRKKSEAMIRELTDRPYRDTQGMQALLSLQERSYFHPATDKLKEGDGALQEMSDHLDQYFMAMKLRLAVELVTRRKVLDREVPIRWLKEVFARLPARDSRPVLLDFYALLYELLEQGKAAQFYSLRELFLARADRLSAGDRQLVLSQLLNYAVRSGNQGQEAFLREAFGLYEYGLDNRLLFDRGKLTDSTFLNFVLLGGKIGELDKVEAFINGHARYLEPIVRADAVTLARANVLYWRGHFAAVDDLIGAYRFDSDYYQLRSRLILLRALFEYFLTDDSYFDLLQAKMEAFEKWLRRKGELGSAQRKPHLAFVQALRQVALLRINPSRPEDRERLAGKISESEGLPNKDWLLRQIGLEQ